MNDEREDPLDAALRCVVSYAESPGALRSLIEESLGNGRIDSGVIIGLNRIH